MIDALTTPAPCASASVPMGCIVVFVEHERSESSLVARAASLAVVIAASVIVVRIRSRRKGPAAALFASAAPSYVPTWEVDGELPRAVQHVAELWQPVLIMLSATEPKAAAAADISSRFAVPLLVWRESCSAARILAASDLEHPRFPVLRGGSDIGAWLQAPLVALHNVTRLGDVGFPPTPCSVSFALEDALRARSATLTSALSHLEIRACGIVSFHHSTARAITETARRELADLVVVGRRARPWWKRVLTHSVAAELVAAAEFSVLVIPM